MPKLTHPPRPEVAPPVTAAPSVAAVPVPLPVPDPGPAPELEPSEGRRGLTRFTKIGLAVVLLLSLTEAGAFISHYVLVSSRYVITDNAQIDGTAMEITAPASGVLSRWTAGQGSAVTPKEVIGRIRVGGPAGPQVPIKSPGRGQVARTTATEGRWVSQGTRLATAYDPGEIHVTARVAETAIRDVRLGVPVDISVDAFPGVAMTGLVTGIQVSTAGKFTVYPNPKDNPVNPQHTDQYIPVQIAITDSGGVEVLPGMNVTVRIHRSTSTD